MNGLPKSLREYSETYLADLLAALAPDERGRFVSSLAIGYLGGPFPSRILVQRLIEVSTGTITAEQYRSWVLSDDEHQRSCVEHVLRSLETGFLVGGERTVTLAYLANADLDADDTDLITGAGARGLLTGDEVAEILEHALSLPPLPPPPPLPDGIEALPPDYPEPRGQSAMLIGVAPPPPTPPE